VVTYQRRRGIPAQIWKSLPIVDSRLNTQQVADADGPHEVRVWIYPQRSAKAEVPGQQKINVNRIGCSPDLEGVDLWSKVVMLGKTWDVVSPPALHIGSSRHTRHWSIDVRERPSG
jgi:hypothetical protein